MDIKASPLERAERLYGAEGMERIAAARAIIFGVGGVGSWCAEALVRSGIGHLTMVDADVVDPTNINRQLPATTLTVGRPKAEVMLERMTRIRPDCDLRAVVAFYGRDNADEFALGDYDVVIDAIDSLDAKATLIRRATAAPGVRLLSSMGAAMREDPSMVADAEFWSVKGCALARALRQKFKRSGDYPSRKFRCVFSLETPHGEHKGTSMAVTATFGLRLAALALDLIKNNNPHNEK